MLKQIVLILLVLVLSQAAPRCIDENGNEVDWWIILKAPNGVEYGYMDANSQNIAMSSYDLANVNQGALSNTIRQIFDNKGSYSMGYAAYNDQDAIRHKSHDTFAHAKGFMAFTENGGFWVSHSTPKFPNLQEESYGGCCPSTTYGQHYMCSSYDSIASFEDLAMQMEIARVYVYDFNLPSSLRRPNLVNWLEEEEHFTKAYNRTITLTTAAGMDLIHMSKDAKWGKELYEDYVAVELGNDLYTETWQNGIGSLDSYCRKDGYKYNVMNLNNVKLPNGPSWRESQDHSKWNFASRKYYVCLNDINRQSSQSHRGGGATCMHNYGVHKAFRGIMQDFEQC
eukprot:TRINITY_DN773182_c0_g1_i1.p1 TRINITY_DN773182_c0_g1~~TRINITY_DN773182_c0_g1_i1.p1  ORF type:complete len:339 (+),score=76.89 TRINITY_DN773182_c0_g1_i1:106-1122(+)